MGRPPKYSSETERKLARKEQNRVNVRAYRRRRRNAREAASESAVYSTLTPVQPQPRRLSATPSFTSSYSSGYSSSDDSDAPWWIEETAQFARAQLDPITLPIHLIEAMLEHYQIVIGVFSWPEALAELRTEDKVLEMAILAFCARWVARRYCEQSLEDLSRRAYQIAVRLLREHMREWTPEKVVLLAVVNLAFQNFESFDGPDDDFVWLRHFGGCMALMKQAGPTAFQSPLGLELLRVVYRPRILFAGFFARQALFLDDDQWRVVPFQQFEPSSEDKLWQLSEQVPGYLQRWDALNWRLQCVEPGLYLEDLITLWEDLNSLRQRFEGWWTALLAAEDPTLLWEQQPSPDFIWNTNEVLGDAIYFRSIDAAEQVVNYWGSLLYLIMTCLEVKAVLINLDLYGSVTPSDVREGHAAQLARHICRAAEYIFGGPSGDYRGTVMSGQHSLMGAIHFFNLNRDQYAQEVEWCAMLRQVARKRGSHKNRWFDLFLNENNAPEDSVKREPWRRALAMAVEKSDEQDLCPII